MELGSALRFLENTTILVTGAAGFLAKIFVEKILRVQPNVKQLYLLLRAPDSDAALQRFNTEIIGKELFQILKEKFGKDVNSLISEKVTIVAGDVSCENLGVKDSDLLSQMLSEVDVVVNLAATTKFDERYDVALGINTMGPKHVLDFAKKCHNLRILLHVSTAYVSGEKEGLIPETPYKMGESLNGKSGLDIDGEKKVMEEALKDLTHENASQESITSAMKELGIQRARMYGWPNTYVFTKAMGEMLLGEFKEDLPLVIIRPTIITSTYKEPFPGWVEGIRTIDSLGVGYGKGKLTCFLGDPKTITDVIPADMVVNAMIVAMVAHSDERGGGENIYHLGSSVSNPIEFSSIQDYGYRYFTKHPWIGKDGKPVRVGKVTVLSSMASFQRYMAIRYLLPLKGLGIVNTACCQYFQRTYNEMNIKIKFVMRLVDLYGPYLFFKGVFDDMNTEKLRRAAKGGDIESDLFYFDPKVIKWDDYFLNDHISGVIKRNFNRAPCLCLPPSSTSDLLHLYGKSLRSLISVLLFFSLASISSPHIRCTTIALSRSAPLDKVGDGISIHKIKVLNEWCEPHEAEAIGVKGPLSWLKKPYMEFGEVISGAFRGITSINNFFITSFFRSIS